MQWVLVGGDGKQHHVGLYHGNESGHLVIYCNDEIVTIDFNVLNDKTYNFFIGDELCSLEVEKKDVGFAYGFKIDEKAPTELNKARWLQDKKDAWSLLIWVGVFFLIIILAVIIFTSIA